MPGDVDGCVAADGMRRHSRSVSAPSMASQDDERLATGCVASLVRAIVRGRSRPARERMVRAFYRDRIGMSPNEPH
jgi:hypothetical protein